MEAKTGISGAPSAVESAGSTMSVSAFELKRLSDCRCPVCGEELVFGSRDPAEGDYYWCRMCDNGPILFPLNYRRKFIAPIIDSEEANEALVMVRRLTARRACP